VTRTLRSTVGGGDDDIDLYGHLWDTSLWVVARCFTDTTPTSESASQESEDDADRGADLGWSVVPPAGFEPATHGLGNRRT